jgi:hypothetical protein
MAVMILFAGCGNGIKSKEKVQEAIIGRLQAKSGLDLNSLDITTTSVSFNKNMAFATVAFHPKADPSVNHGMTMKYTLEDRGGKWVVVNVANSQGSGMMGHPDAGTDALPAGHPSVGSGSELPPGHPPVNGRGADGPRQ